MTAAVVTTVDSGPRKITRRVTVPVRTTSPGSTEITETFDYSTTKSPRLMELFGQPQANAKGITQTLQALAGRFAAPAGPNEPPPQA